jgi:uncharacterized protein
MRIRIKGAGAMKGIMFAAVILLGSFNVQAQSISGSPYIAVHGKAKTQAVPDVFPLQIVLKDTSLDAAKTQALIEGYASQVVDLTKKMEMEDRDVTISNLSISPEYRYDDKDEEQVFLGNTYQRQIKLKFHTLEKLKQMIDAIPKAKQVQLDTGTFESSQADILRRELLVQAVDDARATAEIMAKAVGKRIGTIHNVSNQGFNLRYVESSDSYSLDSVTVTGGLQRQAGAPPVVLSKGSIQLDQNVYIIYTLID